jgi:hypothetical protein
MHLVGLVQEPIRRLAADAGHLQPAQWKVEHNALLVKMVEERRPRGERVYRESQNNFKVRLSRTITLAGKPDLVSVARTDQ